MPKPPTVWMTPCQVWDRELHVVNQPMGLSRVPVCMTGTMVAPFCTVNDKHWGLQDSRIQALHKVRT